MTNVLNEEIVSIKYTIAHLKMGMAVEPDPSRKNKMKNSIKELNEILEDKLKQCGD